MSTLLLRLAAPLQSWGESSKFDTRNTAREPTKSGVIGMIAAAFGCSRTDSEENDRWFAKLNKLKFAVRIDQPGILLRDFHTAKKPKDKTSFVTVRYYLADAVFLVGLEGDESFLKEIMDALLHPVFPVYLGRKSCPPSGQLVLGIRNQNLLQAIEEEEWLASDWYQKKQSYQLKCSIVRDADPNEQGTYLQRDVPVSFDQKNRRYGFRYISYEVDKIPMTMTQHVGEVPTEYDVMAELED